MYDKPVSEVMQRSKALKAAPRPNRQSADAGRRKEIQALLAKIPAE